MQNDKHEYRDLLLSILLLGLVYWFKRWDELIVTALVFILLGLAFKQFRVVNHWFWTSMTRIMQLVFQPIIGGIIFFLFLTPLGLLSQLFRKKKMSKGSTFIAVDQKFDQDFFKKQW